MSRGNVFLGPGLVAEALELGHEADAVRAARGDERLDGLLLDRLLHPQLRMGGVIVPVIDLGDEQVDAALGQGGDLADEGPGVGVGLAKGVHAEDERPLHGRDGRGGLGRAGCEDDGQGDQGRGRLRGQVGSWRDLLEESGTEDSPGRAAGERWQGICPREFPLSSWRACPLNGHESLEARAGTVRLGNEPRRKEPDHAHENPIVAGSCVVLAIGPRRRLPEGRRGLDAVGPPRRSPSGSISSPPTSRTPSSRPGSGRSPTASSRPRRTRPSGPRRDYENFVLDLEFMTAPGTNSGVIVYCSDIANWIPNSVEIQIADDFAERVGQVAGHLALRRDLRPPRPGEERRQEARRVESLHDHLRRETDHRRPQRRDGHGHGHEPVDLGQDQSRRQRDPGLAEPAQGGARDERDGSASRASTPAPRSISGTSGSGSWTDRREICVMSG